MDPVVLRTDRLVVRRLDDHDLEAMFAVYGDPDAMRWVDDGEPIERDECRRWIEVTRRNYDERGYGMFAVELDGDVIGFAGLVHPGGRPTCELKYAYLREHWGRGFATEVARALLEYAQREHGITQVIATTAPENTPSHRVLLKAGMADSGVRVEDDGERVHYFAWSTGAG